MIETTRSFLFLQGPVGPFFKELSIELEVLGHRVQKVNFWGGDEAFFPGGISFAGKIQDWPSFFVKVCGRHAVTDVVLFGDRRSYHEIAVEMISEANPDVRVWVFEEGYFRPNWVTMDHFGVNARSSLPKTGAELLQAIEAFSGSERDAGNENVEPWIREFAPTSMRYYLSGLLKSGAYPNFDYHRKKSPVDEFMGWAASYILKAFGHNEEGDLGAFKEENFGRHFIVPLQLEGDYQMRKYSPFKKSDEFMTYVLKSFSRFAKGDDVLVIKSHPYDYKWWKRRAKAYEIAEKFKVRDRVFFIHRCGLGELLSGCSGCITINSTFGLSALESGVPVKALGQVFWNAEYLTSGGELDHFWGSPKAVDSEAFRLFKSYVMAKTQFNGGFYSKQARSLCVRNIANELSTGVQDTHRLSQLPKARLAEKRKKKISEAKSLRPVHRKLDMSL